MPIATSSNKPVSFLLASNEPDEPEVDWLTVPDVMPVIGEDLQYILDLYEDDEITQDELIAQAQSVGYSAAEVRQILDA